ncbi:MAG: glycosyltransferase family 2 protein [Bacillota bacterium]|jgi:glycosyltransferase involved in cell wall biosynthesis
MKYTIVIPVYNKEAHLYKAIQSAFNQSLPPASIIVIDDCSTDNSMMKIKDFVQDSRLKIIQLKKNSGISKVLNEALKHIKTPYFIQLDGDDWLERFAAERLVTAMHKNPSAAFAFGDHRLWQYNQRNELVFIQNLIQPVYASKYDFLLKLGYMVNPRCYRTSCIRHVGGWITDDPWDGRYFEDARMIIRLAEQFAWIHINEVLHNVLIDYEKAEKKYPMYSYLRRSFYEEMIRRWGNEYTPVWKTHSNQLVYLERLVKN